MSVAADQTVSTVSMQPLMQQTVRYWLLSEPDLLYVVSWFCFLFEQYERAFGHAERSHETRAAMFVAMFGDEHQVSRYNRFHKALILWRNTKGRVRSTWESVTLFALRARAGLEKMLWLKSKPSNQQPQRRNRWMEGHAKGA